MTFGDFIERLCYLNKMVIQIWLYTDGFANPIAIVQPDWEAVKIYSNRKITSIHVGNFDEWTLELKIILESPIFGQTFNPD